MCEEKMTNMRSDDSKKCNRIPIEHAYHLHIDQTVAKSKKSGNCGKENLTSRLCGHQWSKLREEQDAEAQDTEAAACDRESSRALLRKALKKICQLEPVPPSPPSPPSHQVKSPART